MDEQMTEQDVAAKNRKTSFEILESASKKLGEIIGDLRGARIQNIVIGESVPAVEKAREHILFAKALIDEEKTVDELTCGS